MAWHEYCCDNDIIASVDDVLTNRMKAFSLMRSKYCNTDGKILWTARMTYLIIFHGCILANLWTFQSTLVLYIYIRCNVYPYIEFLFVTFLSSPWSVHDIEMGRKFSFSTMFTNAAVSLYYKKLVKGNCIKKYDWLCK